MRADLQAERIRASTLTAGTLARFAAGLAWPAIFALGGGSMAWWRRAVPDAEDRGLLEWDRDARVWRLTEAGREMVRSVA